MDQWQAEGEGCLREKGPSIRTTLLSASSSSQFLGVNF